MTVKELKECLKDIPDNYLVIADDGRDGMESGSAVDAVVIIEHYKRICMATGFEKED